MSWSEPVKIRYTNYLSLQDSRNTPPEPYTVLTNSSSEQDTGMPVNRQITFNDLNWRQKVAKKQDASHPYRRTLTEIHSRMSSASTMRWRTTYTQRSRSYSNFMYGLPSSFPLGTDASLQELALQRIKRKIQSHSGTTNVCVPIAELKDLRGLIRSMADLTQPTMVKLIAAKKLREGARITHVRAPWKSEAYKKAASAWLSYSFGISPMMAEVRQIAESISDFIYRENHNVVLTGSASRDWFGGTKNAGSEQGPIGSTLNFDTLQYHELSYQWKGGFHIPVSAANDYDMMDHFGLKLPSLVPVAWELIPYSWVVDYFTNVGTFLDDVFTITPGVSKYLTCTRVYRCHGQQRPRYVVTPEIAPSFTVLQDAHTPLSQWHYLDFERTVHSAIPMSQLRVKTADEISRNSISKLLNLAAVLVK